MRLTNLPAQASQKGQALAFTLIEVVMCVLISTMVFSGTLVAYIQTARYAEWSGYSLAAQALSVQQLEQAKCALWDTRLTPVVDQSTNLNLQAWTRTGSATDFTWTGMTNAFLDIPITGTNFIRATNYVSVHNFNLPGVTPAVAVKMLMVRTVWPFRGEMFTNSIATYIVPDR